MKWANNLPIEPEVWKILSPYPVISHGSVRLYLLNFVSLTLQVFLAIIFVDFLIIIYPNHCSFFLELCITLAFHCTLSHNHQIYLEQMLQIPSYICFCILTHLDFYIKVFTISSCFSNHLSHMSPSLYVESSSLSFFY